MQLCFWMLLQCDNDSCPCKFLDCFRLGIWLVGLRVMKRFVFGNQFCQLAITSYFYSTASQNTKIILVRKCEMSRDDAYISSILYILKLPLIVTNYWKQTLLISDCTFFLQILHNFRMTLIDKRKLQQNVLIPIIEN